MAVDIDKLDRAFTSAHKAFTEAEEALEADDPKISRLRVRREAAHAAFRAAVLEAEADYDDTVEARHKSAKSKATHVAARDHLVAVRQQFRRAEEAAGMRDPNRPMAVTQDGEG